MTDASERSFSDISEDIAARFVHSVIMVNDRAFKPRLEASAKPGLVMPPSLGRQVPEVSAPPPESSPEPVSGPKPPNVPSLFVERTAEDGSSLAAEGSEPARAKTVEPTLAAEKRLDSTVDRE